MRDDIENCRHQLSGFDKSCEQMGTQCEVFSCTLESMRSEWNDPAAVKLDRTCLAELDRENFRIEETQRDLRNLLERICERMDASYVASHSVSAGQDELSALLDEAETQHRGSVDLLQNTRQAIDAAEQALKASGH